MRVNPIGPQIPFKMRLKNTDIETKTGVEPKSELTFKQVLKEVENEGANKPNFMGHWPPYCISSMPLDTDIINHLYPLTHRPLPPTNPVNEDTHILNFTI